MFPLGGERDGALWKASRGGNCAQRSPLGAAQ
jgi:hypothetical protein